MNAVDFTQLTRCADPERAECWHIYWRDIRAGTITRAVGMPNAQNNWNWSAGFYPGSGPGEIKGGSAGTFEEAKEKFLPAWLGFAQSRSPADFEEWLGQEDWTAWKYRMRDEGMPMPTQADNGRSRCFCGAEITIASVTAHIRTYHREIEEKR